MRANFKIWRESASLILAAKSTFNPAPNCNYKLLCLKRSSKSGVMPNHYVFPGGNISASDSSASWLKIFQNFGYDSNSLNELHPKENVPAVLQQTNDNNLLPKFLSLRICAIRETFEECGVLICRSSKMKCSDDSWASYIGGHEIQQWQHKVHENPNEFIELCTTFDLCPDVWALKLWSNWVTPPSVKSKFDTVFFISAFNQMPDAHPEEKEIQHLMWATPEEYTTFNLNNEVILPIPQFYEISRLKNFNDINVLSKYIADRAKLGCETFLPHRIMTNQGLYSILPGDDLYPKFVDKSVTEVAVVEDLPASFVKNRLHHKTEFLNSLIVDNLSPKLGHYSPKP